MRFMHEISTQATGGRRDTELRLRAQSVIAICCSHFKLPPTAVSSVVKGGDRSMGPQLEGVHKSYGEMYELMRKSKLGTYF